MKNNKNLQAVVDDARQIEVDALKQKYNIHKNSDNLLDAAVPGAKDDDNDNHDVDISSPDKDEARENYVADKKEQHQSLRSLKKQESMARIAAYSAIANRFDNGDKKEDNINIDIENNQDVKEENKQDSKEENNRDREPRGVRPFAERYRGRDAYDEDSM